ncbi:MAG: efflux RND transporter periplasmic adaptor subunit [Marinilabiliaceae bacterium]|nr:efflux RND transporter periplasmic adaptor subunit [Marinilabiliaceae bacterium]
MKRARRTIRHGLILSATLLLISTAGCQKRQSTISEGEFETSRIERGNVETYVLTEGVIEPANEVILLSPAASIIKKIHKEPGQQVEKGDVIVQLDTRQVEARIENLNDQLQMKENTLLKTRLNARSAKIDLAYNAEVKKLRIASIKSVLADQKQLLEVGGVSPAKIEKTKQELVLAEKDLELITEKNAIRLAQLDTDEKGLLLQIEMQQKELLDQQDLLEHMQVKAPSNGIILSVVGKEGEKIAADKLLVNMSDLTRFKVRATIDNDYKNLLVTGRKAYVAFEKTRLEGRIGTINPTLKEGRISFYVRLSQSNHPQLLPNQKVGLQIVERSRKNVWRIPNGEAFGKQKKQNVFIIRDDSAYRQEVKFGLITDDYLEIKTELDSTSQIIISNTSHFNHQESIQIEKN